MKPDGSNWKNIESDIWPWVKSFSKIIGSCIPPTMNGESLYISSDYSGDMPKSKYYTFSYLVGDVETLTKEEVIRRSIRGQYLKNDRRMSFKGLNDTYKQKALQPFLQYADSLEGLLVSIVVSKKLKDLSYTTFLHEGLTRLNLLKTIWKPKAFDRMVNIVHFVSLLISGFAQPRKNIYWYSDEDNLFSNKNASHDVKLVLSKISSYYINMPLGELGIGTTKLNENDFFEEDLNAIPDLAAGCLSEFFDTVYEITDQNKLKDFAYLFPQDLSAKSEYLIDWLSHSKNNLKKVVIVFDRYTEANGYKIWRFDTTTDPRNFAFSY